MQLFKLNGIKIYNNGSQTGVTTNSATATNCESLYELRGIH